MKYNIGNTTFNEFESFLQSQMPGYTVKPAGKKLILCTKDAVLAQIKWEGNSVIAVRIDLNMKNISNILFVAIPAGIGVYLAGFLFGFFFALLGMVLVSVINHSALETCKIQLKNLLSNNYKRIE